MLTCPVCGDLVTAARKVCVLCGTTLGEAVPGHALLSPAAQAAADAWRLEIGEENPASLSTSPGLPVAPPAEGGSSQPTAGPAAPTGYCLVLYGSDKKPIHSFPVHKDVTLIGRRDAVRGTFPDIDLREWLSESASRAVSRKHALLLHTRADDSFSLRPLAGNTGTQIEQDMVEALRDYPLKPGTRLILGGTVRFKFEITS
jgi:hypothetical protein